MRLWYETGDASSLLEISPSRVVCRDTETTGIKSRTHEVLQVALLCSDGETLMNQYVRPVNVRRWDRAQRIHGITPADVERCLPLSSIGDEIESLLSRADLIVGFNVCFALSFLEIGGASVKSTYVFDVMRGFAPDAGRWGASPASAPRKAGSPSQMSEGRPFSVQKPGYRMGLGLRRYSA